MRTLLDGLRATHDFQKSFRASTYYGQDNVKWDNARKNNPPVSHPVEAPYALQALGDRFEVAPGGGLPPLRLFLHGAEKAFTVLPQTFERMTYPLEQHRGYENSGDLWTPGYFRLTLSPASPGFCESARRSE